MKRASSPTIEEELEWIIAADTAEIIHKQKKGTLPKHLKPKEKLRPLAFANPRSFGYGGGEHPWPFSYRRAFWDARYRQGVKNAIKASWTASNWKYAARKLMEDLDLQIWEGEIQNTVAYTEAYLPE